MNNTPPVLTGGGRTDPLQEVFSGGAPSSTNPSGGFKVPPPRPTSVSPYGAMPAPGAATGAAAGPLASPHVAEASAFNRSEMAAQIRQSFDNLVKASPIGLPLMNQRYTPARTGTAPFPTMPLHSPAAGALPAVRPTPPAPPPFAGFAAPSPRIPTQQHEQQQMAAASSMPPPPPPAAAAAPSAAPEPSGGSKEVAAPSAGPSTTPSASLPSAGAAPTTAKKAKTAAPRRAASSGAKGRTRELDALLNSASRATPSGAATLPLHGPKGGNTAPGSGGEVSFEVSRYGRTRVKPLAYWSSERLVQGPLGTGAQGIDRGSALGDLLAAEAAGATPGKGKGKKVAKKRAPGVGGAPAARATRSKRGAAANSEEEEREEEEAAPAGAVKAVKAAAGGSRARGGGGGSSVKGRKSGTAAQAVRPGSGGAGLATLAAAAGAAAAAAAARRASGAGTTSAEPSSAAVAAEDSQAQPSERETSPAPKAAKPPLPQKALRKKRTAVDALDDANAGQQKVQRRSARQRSASAEPDAAPAAAPAAAASSDPNAWSADQVAALHRAWLEVPPNAKNFWQKVAAMVPGRTANECFNKMYDKHPTPPAKKPGGGGGGVGRILVGLGAGGSKNGGEGKEGEGAGAGPSRQPTQNAARKMARQQRRQQHAEEAAAAEKQEKKRGGAVAPAPAVESAEVTEEQQQRDRYIDQILRKRRGRALGMAPHRREGGAGLGGARRTGAAAEASARQVVAALAAARDAPEDARDSEEESDYYWSDAE